MKKFTKEVIQELPKIPRLNLINSCTGYKSANLIATKTADGVSNVAIFSSITHLGSDPALLGFILRPTTVPRNTYKNIKDLGYFTVNHITETMIADAHHSSANYDENISEFDQTNLEEEYYEGISIPFIKNSPVQILCKYLNEYEIKENGTIHIIASIEKIFVEERLLQKDYWLRLDVENVVSINGLDGYCVPKLVDRFEYARPNMPTKSML
ncbi:flavin reductase [Flavobacterium piscinae]|uniref:Flavin oxidoreductase n=1 Tax=Flavobacterium piscinae TaxID=2506424 RepID=A0A4Q1KYY6_9FLAO|nr:flavin reductase [Flavobacterium piscinae]MBC8884001.1 flavin reductase [Flavobacterium piscinae]RXR35608.1 flavin oxidoreductase [Flavobacterium piscinae]